jgi:hypothetical protein
VYLGLKKICKLVTGLLTKECKLFSGRYKEQIKEFGELFQGSYFLQNTRISKNFRFTKLKSITIKQFGDNELKNHFTWTKEELNGDTEFLQP